MFTGIIEAAGQVLHIQPEGTNLTFTIRSGISTELKVDQSLSHNGVCLTVTGVESDTHRVTAIRETLEKTNLGRLRVGDRVNLERCMQLNGRFDGHIVQGHVDQTGTCTAVADQDGSWLFDFAYDPAPGHITVEKGSICVNGVSLTCFRSGEGSFRVAIIPYTYEHTNFGQLREGDVVNLEFDIIGKYLMKIIPEKYR
ncbi:MAG: riboflavin synthase [Cytophagales bacterium]|nr:riboflavin synthase [Cytophagales bacterium]